MLSTKPLHALKTVLAHLTCSFVLCYDVLCSMTIKDAPKGPPDRPINTSLYACQPSPCLYPMHLPRVPPSSCFALSAEQFPFPIKIAALLKQAFVSRSQLVENLPSVTLCAAWRSLCILFKTIPAVANPSFAPPFFIPPYGQPFQDPSSYTVGFFARLALLIALAWSLWSPRLHDHRQLR